MEKRIRATKIENVRDPEASPRLPNRCFSSTQADRTYDGTTPGRNERRSVGCLTVIGVFVGLLIVGAAITIFFDAVEAPEEKAAKKRRAAYELERQWEQEAYKAQKALLNGDPRMAQNLVESAERKKDKAAELHKAAREIEAAQGK